jgi:dipeptidyl aminopeptidase/acylaminoacyl peptidase
MTSLNVRKHDGSGVACSRAPLCWAIARGLLLLIVLGALAWAPKNVAQASEDERLTTNPASAWSAKDEPIDWESSQDSPQGAPRGELGPRRVFRDGITPHWFANDTRFWYRNDLRAEARQFILVDAEQGTREPAFDHAKLATAFSRTVGAEYTAEKLPFDSIEFIDDAKAIYFKVGDTFWRCDLTSYECSKTEGKAPQASETNDASAEPERRGRGQRQHGGETDRSSERSPDGKWMAFVKDHNLFIRSRDDDTKEIQLSDDGKEGLVYGRFSWSPDSKRLAAFRIEPGERKEVYLIQSSPQGGGRAKLQTRPYALPGDKFTTYELNVFDVASRRKIKPEVDRSEHEWLVPRLRWSRDGGRFAYEQTDRGHQRFRVIEVDAQTGEARNLIDERTKSFIWTAHTESLNLSLVTWLERTDEIIYASESNGWRHLYLVDARAAKLKNPITTGNWVVRGIERIDEMNRQVWFRASGVHSNQDPYLIHYGRVDFDGSGLMFLTSDNGNHSIQFSPERRFLIDTYSRVDLPPVNELRRVADGRLVCSLEEADVTDLKSSGWSAPEVFVAKGRDGKTDVWGILCRPRDFDPNRNYPVIEDIYAGPQGSFVPKTFSASSRYASLTRLGFFIVKIDAEGTANRSKAFHDVCWHNLKDGGFQDRILWMKAAAKKYPSMDLTRVGIYGNSAGGQNAAAAVLFHPGFYKVAVASCGCHDNRMDKASWNEQWMGYPVGPHYSECSNIDNAHRLRGKLFLIVGEMDDNVPPESTLRFADALIKAGKDFDLLVIPGGGHGMGGPYGQRRMQDFFVRHLLDKEPPDRNAEMQQAGD